jgi:hypothetical protein
MVSNGPARLSAVRLPLLNTTAIPRPHSLNRACSTALSCAVTSTATGPARVTVRPQLLHLLTIPSVQGGTQPAQDCRPLHEPGSGLPSNCGLQGHKSQRPKDSRQACARQEGPSLLYFTQCAEQDPPAPPAIPVPPAPSHSRQQGRKSTSDSPYGTGGACAIHVIEPGSQQFRRSRGQPGSRDRRRVLLWYDICRTFLLEGAGRVLPASTPDTAPRRCGPTPPPRLSHWTLRGAGSSTLPPDSGNCRIAGDTGILDTLALPVRRRPVVRTGLPTVGDLACCPAASALQRHSSNGGFSGGGSCAEEDTMLRSGHSSTSRRSAVSRCVSGGASVPSMTLKMLQKLACQRGQASMRTAAFVRSHRRSSAGYCSGEPKIWLTQVKWSEPQTLSAFDTLFMRIIQYGAVAQRARDKIEYKLELRSDALYIPSHATRTRT